MILYADSYPVAFLEVVEKTGGRTLAISEDQRYAVILDDQEDRAKSDAVLEECCIGYVISGARGNYCVEYIDTQYQWGVYPRAEEKWTKMNLDRETAIALAYELANGANQSGLS